MRGQASAVVAMKREKKYDRVPEGREPGAVSAILLWKVGGGFKRLSPGEFPINSLKAEPGEKTESYTRAALKKGARLPPRPRISSWVMFLLSVSLLVIFSLELRSGP